MCNLVDVELVAVVGQRGAVLSHQGAEGETKQLLLSLVLGCTNTGYHEWEDGNPCWHDSLEHNKQCTVTMLGCLKAPVKPTSSQ